jgi:hypothetical protein
MDTSYPGSVILAPVNGWGSQAVSATIDGLLPGKVYHYRLIATNEAGPDEGPDATFTTPTTP